MKRKHILVMIALIAVFALALTGCGNDSAAPETEAADVLGLSDWDLTATAWSSSNGATVSLTATPNKFADGQTASFVVRQEGEEIEAVPCGWDGKAYTAEVDLNAADGYCYYVVMRSAEGEEVEVPVNTPGDPSNGKLINMEHSLEYYCHMTVTNFDLKDSVLTITDGSAEIRVPLITHTGEDAVCTGAVLILTAGDRELDRAELTLPETESEGIYQPDVKNISFRLPQLEDDQQLSLTLEATLGDGQVLTAPAGTWFYSEGQMAVAAG